MQFKTHNFMVVMSKVRIIRKPFFPWEVFFRNFIARNWLSSFFSSFSWQVIRNFTCCVLLLCRQLTRPNNISSFIILSGIMSAFPCERNWFSWIRNFNVWNFIRKFCRYSKCTLERAIFRYFVEKIKDAS